MARRTAYQKALYRKVIKPKRTSIGKSTQTRPKNKHKRRNWKPYRRQGK
jgi:hypothetical protein|tara:strand:- start:1155 stop:1301 length:147 start_codon:yes stop_codon:yes gene_type:complete